MPNVIPLSISRFGKARVLKHTAALGRVSLPLVRHGHRRSTHSETITLKPESTVTSEDGNRTIRMRQHGNRSLPLPPLMDPVAIEAKAKHRQPKLERKDEEERSEFQKALAANPYGKMHLKSEDQRHSTDPKNQLERSEHQSANVQ